MKRFFIFLFFLFFLNAICLAESEISLPQNKINEANNDISQIEIDFCDKPGQKEILYTLAPGWIQDICLQAKNVSSKDIETTIEFVDGTITNDQQKNKACMQQWEDKKFWQYITWYIPSFIIPANTTIFRHVKLHLPLSATWGIKWCIVYYTKRIPVGGWMNFSILMRKAKFIDIQVRKNVIIKKYIVAIAIILLLIYYTRIVLYSKKTKKLPQR